MSRGVEYMPPGVGFLDDRFVNVTGDTMIGTNSTTFFQIQQADNTVVFNVDTTTPQVTMPNNPVIGGYTLTVPATGTAALLNQSNSFTLINPLITIAESWIGPSSTAGVYFKGGFVGIGTTDPTTPLHVTSTVNTTLFERTSAVTDSSRIALRIKHTTSGNIANGFGPSMQFLIEDAGATETIAHIEAVRDTADDSGKLLIGTYNGGSLTKYGIVLTHLGNVGIGVTDPDTRLEVLHAGNQLKLSFDATDNATFAVNTDGELIILPSARTIYLGDGTAGDGTFGFYGDTSVFTLIHDDSESELFLSANDSTNKAVIEADGTVRFDGTATVWRDINVGAAQLSRPASSQPDEDNFLTEAGADTGITTLAYAIGEKASGSFEIQHDYKEGSDFTFHVHWQGITAPSGTDNVQWRITYVLMRDGTTLDAVTTIDSVDTAIDTQYESYRSDFAVIDGSTKGNDGGAIHIGDQFLFTIERVASTGDAYAGDALVATIGIHYEVDTIGSRTIIEK